MPLTPDLLRSNKSATSVIVDRGRLARYANVANCVAETPSSSNMTRFARPMAACVAR
jgi:hypothetical protein